jgi:hypothetical protein
MYGWPVQQRGRGIVPSVRRGRVLAGVLLASCSFFLASCSDDEPDIAEQPCADVSVDAERWGDASEEGKVEIARALIRCDTLVGMSANEVQDLFGGEKRVSMLILGPTDDFIGPGNDTTIRITYRPNDRVTRAYFDN